MILIFDTETTGVDPTQDRIIEICLLTEGHAGLDRSIQTFRINPGCPISPAAWAVHGITDEELANKPTFRDCTPAIYDTVKNCDVIIGYNVQFDIDMLQAEFERVGVKWDLQNVRIVDPLKIWRNQEPRTLSSAHERFVGRPLEGVEYLFHKLFSQPLQ
jgi:DNA polymerase-3 subunit epsilon